MTHTPFADPRTLLRRYGLSAKKSWGQNFLIAERVYRAIVDASVVEDDDWVVEFGAGLGTLTARLAERVAEGKVIAVERDPDLVTVLEKELSHLDTVEVYAKNAMTFDLAAIARWCGGPIAVCGNLPYNIGTQILLHALDQRQHLRRMVFMLQREVVDRLLADPGTKAYGALTVIVSARAKPSLVVRAKPGDFSPAPKVASSVVRLEPLQVPRVESADTPLFAEVVHAAFAMRRKTLRNALRAKYGDEATDSALQQCAIDGGRRGETLSVEEYGALTDVLAAAAGLTGRSVGPEAESTAPK